jgi:hypothetical protein
MLALAPPAWLVNARFANQFGQPFCVEFCFGEPVVVVRSSASVLLLFEGKGALTASFRMNAPAWFLRPAQRPPKPQRAMTHGHGGDFREQ